METPAAEATHRLLKGERAAGRIERKHFTIENDITNRQTEHCFHCLGNGPR